jgi:predicted DNA-binding WGR domain protein
MTSQLLLFDPEPDATLPDIQRRTLSDAELAVHLRRLQADFDTRAKQLIRCDGCRGYVDSVDTNGNCAECREPTVRSN